jgi:hypothetical protein
MKLADLFLRATRRASRPTPIEPQARFIDDGTDRSSMADLARLLQEFDDTFDDARTSTTHGAQAPIEMKSDAVG